MITNDDILPEFNPTQILLIKLGRKSKCCTYNKRFYGTIFTWPLMCSIKKQRTFCAALHVSVVIVPPSPSLSMLMLSGSGIISNKYGLPGNSCFVMSLQSVKQCFNLSRCSVAKETKTILVRLFIYRQAYIYITIYITHQNYAACYPPFQ